MAAVQATDKAAELVSSFLVTHCTAGHTLSWGNRGCLVWLRGLNQDCCNFYQAFPEWQKYSAGSSSTVYEGIQQYGFTQRVKYPFYGNLIFFCLSNFSSYYEQAKLQHNTHCKSSNSEPYNFFSSPFRQTSSHQNTIHTTIIKEDTSRIHRDHNNSANLGCWLNLFILPETLIFLTFVYWKT